MANEWEDAYQQQKWRERDREAVEYEHYDRNLGRQADAALQEARGGQSVAQQQLRQGLGQAQSAQAGQSLGRGNPLAQRAAMYQGGQMAAQTDTQGKALRAQEMQAARLQALEAAQAQAGMSLQERALWQQQEGMEAAGSLARDQFEADQRQRDWERGWQVAGTIASVAGGGAGAMSDERMKTSIDQPEMRIAELEARLRRLEGGR
jgi:hypothetical protein